MKENIALLEQAKKELEKIEYKKRTWKSDLMREMDIWECIACEINSYTGKKQKYWLLVMDLFNEKYR
jgi:hypothetical protein